jgi:fumarylacetoacetate (FAA) hydrolase
MKLATYKDGSRDGQLLVVSRDLNTAHYATGIANHLQQVLDDWNFLSPQLQDLYQTLNQGKARHAFPFDPQMCMAPLPRGHQFASGAAYLSQLELMHAANKTDGTDVSRTEPLMRQGSSDDLLGPCDDVVCASEADDIDFGAEIAVITGDIPMACSPERSLDGIRLVLLANALSLRGRMAGELATSFSPVAVTLDELGDAWSKGRLHLTVQSAWNGRKIGLCDAGPEMNFHFGQLIAHLARTRRLRAGCIVASGTLGNKGVQVKGRMSWPKGYSCIAEKRAMETLQDGAPSTGFMKFGDTIRIEVKGKDGQSVFGAIEQAISPLTPLSPPAPAVPKP